MRVYLRHNKLRFIIPVPIWVLALISKPAIKHLLLKYSKVEHRKYIECIDFDELNKAFHLLNQYRGMELVNVRAEDGTEVNIRV